MLDLSIFTLPLILVLYLFTIAFILSVIKHDNSIVDIFWGLGFILVAFVTLVKSGDFLPKQVLITILTCIWGIRLSTHLFMRKLGKGEDRRYTELRKKWGKHKILRAYIQVFLFQGLLLIIISTPIILINTFHSASLSIADQFGLFVWCFGFIIESISDYQLRSFKKIPENRDKLLQEGLWKYSRHPNYFGESLMWWGIAIIALTTPYGIFALISPILITLLLLFVSGIPLLEQKYKTHAEYMKYASATSKFVLWFPKNGK